LHAPVVGGFGQSVAAVGLVQVFVQIILCWIIWHLLYVASVQSLSVAHV
jgi:hypothetical protein